jgi:glucan phosphorylase
MIRAAADLKVPMIAVTLLHRKGYFYQRLDANGWQSEDRLLPRTTKFNLQGGMGLVSFYQAHS